MFSGLAALISLGLGAAGAAAGAQGQRQTTTSSISLPEASFFENQLGLGNQRAFTGFRDAINAGPGVNDISAATASSRNFASMLGQFAQDGGMPTRDDFSRGRGFAQELFAPEQFGLQRQFDQDLEQANRMAGASGLMTNDPVLRARLLQDRNQRQGMLNAEQRSFTSQFAQQQPFQRLQFAGQQADVQNQLAQQALTNRFNLLNVGSQLLSQERQFRLAQATRTNETTSGGGFAGALSGGLAGAGMGLSAASMFGGSSFGGMGAGMRPQFPMSTPQMISGGAASPQAGGGGISFDFQRALNLQKTGSLPGFNPNLNALGVIQ